LNGVSLWDVNLEMYVVFSEAEFAELKAKAFKVPERLDTGVDVAFFSEVPVSFVCWKHHGHPVIAGVIRNLFRVTTTYKIHNFVFLLSHPLRGRRMPAACDKKKIWFVWRKKRCDFSSDGSRTLFQEKNTQVLIAIIST